MTYFQKVIKYSAIFIAAVLILEIFIVIISVITIFFNIFNNEYSDSKMQETDKTTQLIGSKKIDIDVSAVDIIIKEGENFELKTNNKYINIKNKDDKIYIKESKKNIIKRHTSTLTIYIPRNYYFDSVEIDGGAGQITIDNLLSNQLFLNLGAGSLSINAIEIIENVNIEGGAGNIEITHSNLNNLKLNMGVGQLNLSGKITGNSKINAGVGKMNIELEDSIDNYNFNIEKGIGSILLNNKTIPNNYSYGSGFNKLKLSGGIGNIIINTNEEG